MSEKKDGPDKSAPQKPAGGKPTGGKAKLKKATVESLTEQSPSESPESPEAKLRTSGLRTWIILALVVLAFGGGLVVWSKYSHQLEGVLPAAWLPGADRASQRVDEVAGALDALAARLAGVEAAMADRTAVQDLADKLNEALAQIAQLQARPALPADLPDRLNDGLNAANKRLDEVGETSTAALKALADNVAAQLAARPDQASGALPDDLQARLSALETAPRPAAEASDMLAKMAATLARLEAANQDLQARLATTEARLAARAEATGGDNAAAVLIAAIGQLRLRADGGAAFAADLAAVKSLLGDGGDDAAAALSGLAPHAAQGVATVDLLARRFAAVAARLARAVPAEKTGWVGRAWARLADLVSVRRTGEVEGAGNEARVARAEARLAAGDLAAAVAEVSALSGPGDEAAADWLARARARLAVDEALAVLSRHALGQMSSGQKIQ